MSLSSMNIGTETLESMCELIVDCPHSTPKWTDEGIIVLRNKNIKKGVLDLSSPSYTNEEDYKKRIKRAVPQAGDIVFTREAPMGEVCMIPEDLKCCLGQRQVLLRPKDDVCGEYLFWALQSPLVQHQISWNEGTGSTISNVRIPVLKALNIPRHPDEEEHIAKVLSDLAGKIKLNRQTNQTLEQIAQAIFKSWFVDFEPVRAKIKAKQNGQDPELAAMCAISGKTEEQLKSLDEATQQQLKTIAALFPDALIESELGEIPEGWGVGDLGDICEQAIGGQWGKDDKEGDLVPAICLRGCDMEDVRDFGFAPDAPIRYIKQNALEKRLMNEKNLLIAASGAGPCGRPLWCSPHLSKEQYGVEVIYSNFVKRFNCSTAAHAIYIDNIIYEKYKTGTIGDYITGTAVPNLDASGLLSSFQLVLPIQAVLNEFAKFYKVNEERKSAGENRTLKNIWDLLLPKLLSGEVQLEKHQAELEEAVG